MQLLRYVSACSVGRKTYYPKCTLCSVAERKKHIVYVKLLQEEKGGKEREKEAGKRRRHFLRNCAGTTTTTR